MTWWDALKSGAWATRDRLVPAGLMALLAYCVLMFYFFVVPGLLSAGDLSAPFNDFLSFWTAAHLAVTGEASTAYDLAEFAKLQTPLLGEGRYFAFFYPPVFLLYLWPLGLIGGVAALFVFLVVSTFGLGAALSRIVGSWQGFLQAAALPTAFTNMFYGQNGALSAAFLAAALWCLRERKEWLAGAFVALLIYKPQMGVLIPFALIAGGYWRTFLSASLCAVGLILLSLLAFGFGAWEAFLQQIEIAGRVVGSGMVDLYKFISVNAALQLLGMPEGLAKVFQALVALGMVVLVVRAWRRPKVDFADKANILVVGGLLASPFALCYDLALLAVPLAFHLERRRRCGPMDFEDALFCLAIVIATAARIVAETGGLPIAPLGLALVLVASWRRIAAQATDDVLGP